MKNLVAKSFLLLVLVSGSAAFASAKTSVNSALDPETIVKNYSVEAYQLKTHSIYLKAGETVYIKASGDGYTDLDMFVRDSAGTLIVKDDRTNTDGYVFFTAGASGYYEIKVVNKGNSLNNYQLKVDIY